MLDADRRHRLLDQVERSLLASPGALDPELRRRARNSAFAISGGTEVTGGELPDALTQYVDRVALDAAGITDEDIERLRDDLDDEVIFEATLLAALGAAALRLKRGLGALEA
jgi:hypothetical protein